MISQNLGKFFIGAALMHGDAQDSHKIVLQNSSLAKIFGGKSRISASTEFIWMDDKDRYLSVQETVDWRGKARGYQLVLKQNEVTLQASAGAGLCIAQRRDDNLLVIMTPKGDQVYHQMNWLFGVMNQVDFDHLAIPATSMFEHKIGYPEKMILGQIGLLPALV